MNSIIFLLVLFISVTLLHLAFLTKTYVQFSIPWLLPDFDNSNYPKFNPSTDRFRTMLTIALFTSPLILFEAYKNLAIENITIDTIVLILLFSLTCFLLYANKYMIWSKSFRTISRNKNKTELKIISIEETLSNHANAINQNNYTLNCLNSEITNKRKSVEEKENKSLESYFKSNILFQKTETALIENNFFTNKNNLTAVKLSILTYKLQKLKIININKRNKYFCQTLEKHFGVKKIDPGMLSSILNSLEDGSAIPKHYDLLKEFVYLDKLN